MKLITHFRNWLSPSTCSKTVSTFNLDNLKRAIKLLEENKDGDKLLIIFRCNFCFSMWGKHPYTYLNNCIEILLDKKAEQNFTCLRLSKEKANLLSYDYYIKREE